MHSFSIKNYKCYEDINTFYLPGLTYLTGTNNSGKSTIIQSLFLLSQANEKHIPILPFNDRDYSFGNFEDVLNKNKTNNDSIGYSIEINDESNSILNLEYHNPKLFDNYSLNDSDVAVLTQLNLFFTNKKNKYEKIFFNRQVDDKYHTYNCNKHDLKVNIYGLNILPKVTDKKEFFEKITYYNLYHKELTKFTDIIDKIKYIKAYRTDAKSYYQSIGGTSNDIGLDGRYAAEVLYKNWDKPTFFDKERPLHELFKNFITFLFGEKYDLTVKRDTKSTYRIVIHDGYNDLDLSQVGFGFSQIIPVLTLILLSKEKDLLLIENPEVHLHPRLQSCLADLFVFAIKHGRKLIVETHSEHIINKTRLLVKMSDDKNLKDKINIYFFEKNEDLIKTQEIKIDAFGKISNWPKGFFDQTYIDSVGLIEDE